MGLAAQLQALSFYENLGYHAVSEIFMDAGIEHRNPDTHEVICGFALGVLDSLDSLPEELRDKEKPSPRKALKDIWLQY